MPLGIPLTLVGIAFMHVVSSRMLERADGVAQDTSPAQRTYVTEAVVLPGSRFVNATIRDIESELSVRVQALRRGQAMISSPEHERLRPDDIVVFSGTLDDILRIKDLRSISLLADLRRIEAARVPSQLVEIAIPPTSMLEGRSIGDVRFADRYGLVVVAVHRHPALQITEPELDLLDSLTAGETLKNIRLSVGDMLLVRGPEPRLRELHRDEDLTILAGVDYVKPRYERAPLAVLIFGATVVIAGLRIVSPAIAGLTGLLVMLALKCVSAATAFRVDWRVVIMIGALLTLGVAMERSGAGAAIAQTILPLATTLGPHGTMILLMLLTVLLSIPMSNQAAALIMLPIGVHTAMDIGVNPRTFAIATCLAASCAFVTPFEPAAALVYGAGRYRVKDFLRVGTPITIASLAILGVGVPLVWPFHPS
jgi:di/tricarboxylate transporter